MIILDTHVWIWWVNSIPNTLPDTVKEAIESAETRVCVASVSCLEVAWLVRKQRIELPCSLTNWFELALNQSAIELLPLTPEVASAAAFLPHIHKDPIDRIIIATAMQHNATLITKDERIKSYPQVLVLWA